MAKQRVTLLVGKKPALILTMRKMFRWKITRNKARYDGVISIGFGQRIGYWPCLRGPFFTVSFLFWRVHLWYGLPSKEQLADK